MKYTNQKLGNPGICLLLCALLSALAGVAVAQAFGTTTVQGTVYLANGAPGSGTLQLSWPAFTTSANQAVAAGRTTVSIASDGFVSVKLAPNVGAMPAGLFYTAVYHLSDGTTSTEYWVVPAAAQAALAQVRAQVMPAAQAVQAVNKAYVDQSISQLVKSQVTSSGGTLTGPLYLNGDPVTSPQAASKHYVDSQVGQTLSINGGAANGPLTAMQLGAAFQADQFPGTDFGAKLQACISALDSTYGGSCDARNFSGTLSMGSNLTIAKGNVTINLPCATIATSSQIVVTAGTRNVTLHGCASRGTSAASGSQGGTVFMYSGNASMVQVGDATYAANTLGFHLDNVALNTTSSSATTARAVTVWRAQEVHLESLYLLGNANQTGITLDGTGNYTGGTFQDLQIGGFQTALNAIGHQAANAATTDWVNASTFVRLHINCPTSDGSAIAGTTGINLAQGDGDTFTGGDVEGCATALHLGPNAQNNTIVGLRNENSTSQVVAEAGSAYNNWITGGTMFTGKLTDNGTRNSFLDTFHRSFNALNGDWFGSQQDSTITNHYRLGIGSGNERGLLHRYQTDSGYRWTMGLTDATAGEQYYSVLDELNNVNRLSIGQYNTGQGSSNNQTVVNAAGTGAVVLNGSNNAGSGGVVFGSGGPSSTTVATINNAGNAQFNGSLQVSGASTFLNSTSIKNQADAEIDAFLWAGATAPQKESVVYKDWNGTSQWYMVKDTSNNWALNSAVGGVDSFKAYQSNNSGDTYIDAANNLGVVRVNYEPGSGSAFNIYGGSSSNLYASFNGATGIKFPGLAAGAGKNCVQIDNSGYLSNTGVSCGSSSVGAGTAGQIAYYPGNGSAVAGMSSSGALATLGGLPLAGGTLSGPLAGTSASFSGNVQATTSIPALTPVSDVRHPGYGAKCDGTKDDTAAVQAAINAAMGTGGSGVVFIPDGCFIANASALTNPNPNVQLTIEMQGTLKLGSTFTIPVGTAIKCLGKGEVPQFATGSATCQVLSPPGHGTLGTAITSVNTPVTITPTFVGSSMANLTVGSGITMAGVMSCTANATRDNTLVGATYPGVGPTNTTFSILSCLDSSGNSVGFRIPPAAKIVVTGCSDTSFNNSSSFNRQAWFSTLADFPAKTLGTRMPGGSGTVSDGSCTVTGLNMDSFETETIEAVSGSTVTLRTNHTHAASDLWGEVGMAWTPGDLRYKPIEGVNVIGNYGAGMWARFNFSMDFIGSQFQGGQYLTSVPMVFSSSWGLIFAKSQTSSFSGYTCPASTYQCGDIGPPFNMMFDLLPQSIYAVNAAGGGQIGPNSTVSIGIYVTNATATTANYNGFDIFNSVIEQPMWNAITYDNRNVGSIEGTTWDYSLLQDDLVGWSQASFTGMTDVGSYGKGSLHFFNNTNMSYGAPGFAPSTVNRYFCGKISASGSAFFGSLVAPTCPQATVTLNDGLNLSGELTSPPMGPNYIPYATQPTLPLTGCTGTGCTVTGGQRDPFGGTNAVLLSASPGNYATAVFASIFPLIPTSAGDVFMYGVKVRVVDGVSEPIVQLQTFGTDTFDTTTNGGYQSEIVNGGWRTIIGFSTVLTGSSTPHAMTFAVTPSIGQTGASAYFAQPFVYRIPASSNIPLDEIKRWRAETSHGYVPSSFTGPGYVFAPTDVLYWGSDTTLKRNAAGVLEGNGSLILDSVATSPNTAPVCPNGTGGALTTSGCVAGSVPTNTPAWLTYLGTGADGANTTASGNLCGDFYYTNFTVPFGNAVTCLFNSGGLIIHATGTCTIAGTITTNTGSSGGYNGTIISGPTAGGSGGGTAGGTAGGSSFTSTGGTSILAGGAAGAASGGNGGNGNPLSASQQRMVISNGLGVDGQYLGMAGGKQGGSSGGAGGFGGQNVVLMCNTITGTDGTHTGTINVSGTAGGNSAANNTGAGSGGAGGFVILSSQNAIPTLPTITVTGGAGGTCGAFTGCGTGGKGGDGWSAVFQGW